MIARCCRIGVLFALACWLAQAGCAAGDATALLAQWRKLGPEARARAVQAVAKAKNPVALKPIVALLADANAPFVMIRIDGLRYTDVLRGALRQYGTAAIDPLAEALKTAKNTAELEQIAGALADTGSQNAVKPLLAYLQRLPKTDLQAARARAVADALGRLGKPGWQALAGLLREQMAGNAWADAISRPLAAAGAPALSAVAPLLKDKSATVRTRARQIIQLYGPVIVPLLIEILEDPQGEARLWAIDALMDWGDARAFAPLLAQLGDADDEIREHAAYALAESAILPPAAPDGAHPAVDPLLGLLGDANPQVCRAARHALGVIGPPTVDPLMKRLQAQQPEVRQAAITVLGVIRDPRAADALRLVLKGPSATDATLAAIALAGLRDPAAIDTLLAAAGVIDHPMRTACLIALQYYQDPRATTVLLKALADADPRVRVAAINALGLQRSPEAVSPLIASLQTDDDWQVRRMAVEALGSFNDSRAVDALLGALRDADHNIRYTAAEALGRTGDPRALAVLLSGKLNGTIIQQDLVLAGLGRACDPRAVQGLLKALASPRSNLRVIAIEGMGQIGDPAAVPALIKALKDPTQAFHGLQPIAPVRQAAAAALGQIRDRRAVEPLITALNDRVPTVARAAARSLTAITGQSFGMDPAAWRAWWAQQGSQ